MEWKMNIKNTIERNYGRNNGRHNGRKQTREMRKAYGGMMVVTTLGMRDDPEPLKNTHHSLANTTPLQEC